MKIICANDDRSLMGIKMLISKRKIWEI